MELHIVKDMVLLKNLEEEWAGYKDPPSLGKPSPWLDVDLDFPSMVWPMVDSKSNREFVGKLRDVIKRNYIKPDVGFVFIVEPNQSSLEAYVTFDVHRYEGGHNEGFNSIFGANSWKIWTRLSLCHLPNKNSPLPPADHLYTFSQDMTSSDKIDSTRYFTRNKDQVEKVQELWDHETGYIHAKLTIGLMLHKDAVKTVMTMGKPVENFKEIGAMTRKILEEEICTDLEIRCGDGAIVKGHRAVLGGRSKVFQNMFEAEKWKEAKMGKLEMEEMSEQSVRALLRWMYWRDEKEALEESNVAVDMLIAGDKYDLEGLVGEMKEIILERRGCDERWFGVESALKLFRWARDLEGLNEFKEMAVRVLKSFAKTCPEKLVESEDYQELIKNDGDAKMNECV